MNSGWRAGTAVVLVVALTGSPFVGAVGGAAGAEAEGSQPARPAAVVASLRPVRTPLGILRGVGQVRMDGPGLADPAAGPASTPVFAGSQVTTGQGAAYLELLDGTRLHVEPRGAVSLGQTVSPLTLQVAKGTTLQFRIPAAGTTVLTTPTARIEGVPARVAGTGAPPSGPRVGVLRVDAAGATRLRMWEGDILVTPRAGGHSQIVPAGAQVTVPDGGPVLVAQAEPGVEAESAAAGFGGNPPEGPLVAAGLVGAAGAITAGTLFSVGAFEGKPPASASSP